MAKFAPKTKAEPVMKRFVYLLLAVAASVHASEYRLWSGSEIPRDLGKIPFAEGILHRTIHDARESDYKFLHGAASINCKGTFFANWANSPRHENYPDETLQGRRAKDSLGKWSDAEVVGSGFEGKDRHSHGGSGC